jgi:hypothetical protein
MPKKKQSIGPALLNVLIIMKLENHKQEVWQFRPTISGDARSFRDGISGPTFPLYTISGPTLPPLGSMRAVPPETIGFTTSTGSVESLEQDIVMSSMTARTSTVLIIR